MGTTRDDGSQQAMWVATADLPRGAGHPFYDRLNQILEAAGFNPFVEALCAPFYAAIGRPSLAPGRYFRLRLLGYFEGRDSERAIAWRAANSLSLRAFLRLAQPADPPDHSTVSRTRRPARLHEITRVKSFEEVQGYHSNETLMDLKAVGLRTYISEPDRGRRCWEGRQTARDAVYANRRWTRGAQGRRLLRCRGELLERPFAHLCETGGMRRVHFRGHPNILKRLLVDVAGCNLGLPPAASDRRRHAPEPSGPARGPILRPDQALVRPVGPSGALLGASCADVAADRLVTAPSNRPAIHLNAGTSATGCSVRGTGN